VSPAKSGDEIRSAQQIENDIKRQREDLEQTVNELAGRLDPKNLAQDAQEQAKEKVTEAAGAAKDFLEEAKKGNLLNIAVLAGSAAACLGVVIRKARRSK